MNDITFSFVLAAEEGGAHANPLIPQVNELMWGAISFGILFLILSKIAFPSLQRSLNERTANIEGKLEEAERERQAATAMLADYEKRVAEAQAEARRVVEEARANAERLEIGLRAQAEQQAERILARAQETIHGERERAVQQLRGEMATLAVDLATRVVGDSLDRERQLRLVDQYLEQVSAGQPQR